MRLRRRSTSCIKNIGINFHIVVLTREFDNHPKLFAKVFDANHKKYFADKWGESAFEYFPALKQAGWGEGCDQFIVEINSKSEE